MKPQTRALHIQVLREEFSRRSGRNQNYSLRAFARSLKVSQGALSEILSGKRIPSPKLLKRIWEQIGAEPDLYKSLVESAGQIQKRRGLRRLNPIYKTQERKTRAPIQDLSIDLYRIISDWYHSAILELPLLRILIAIQSGLQPR
jgi:transcriptional regulator with XRE-family HTH domain